MDVHQYLTGVDGSPWIGWIPWTQDPDLDLDLYLTGVDGSEAGLHQASGPLWASRSSETARSIHICMNKYITWRGGVYK